MSELILPLDRFESSTYNQALENLVRRYEREEEPVHYRKAALKMDESTASSCLNYFNKLGLVEQPGARGVYKPPISTIEMVNDGGTAKEETFDILDDDIIFEEAQFILEQGVNDLEELADSVTSQMDSRFDDEKFGADEDKKKVLRAVEIFDSLDLLSINGETPSETSDEEGNSESTDEIQAPEITAKEVSFEKIPPRRAGPDRLMQICLVLKQGGTWTVDELDDEVEFSEKYVGQTVNYGEHLGFINKVEEGDEVKAASRGFELAYEEELGDSTEELFREAIRDYDEYKSLLSVGIDNIEPDSSGVLEKDDLLKLIRTELGVTEPSDDSLGRAVTTFFDTLEAAGFGEVKAAGGGYSTRLSYDDGSALIKEVSTFESSSEGPEVAGENSTNDVEDSSNEKSEPAASHNEDSVVAKSGTDDLVENDENDIADSDVIRQHRSISIEMEVTLDLAEIDPADLEQKLDQLDSFLDGSENIERED